jgi:ADP-heptose:LPS heptosyltransferase
MKLLDRWVGGPICLLLNFFQNVSNVLPKPTGFPVRKILVMKFFGVGSILLATPMLRALKCSETHLSIGFLTFTSNRSMVERLGLVDVVYTLNTSSPVAFARDLIGVLRLIRLQRYDAVIDMEFFSKFSTIVTWLTGSPIRVGYFLRQMWRGNLLTEQIYYNHYKHITEVFAALTTPLGITVSDYRLQQPLISDEEKTTTNSLLTRMGVEPGKLLIGFNVNASELSLERRWPKGEFVTLAQGLLHELDSRLVFVGSPDEAAYVEGLLADLPRDGRVINLVGKSSLGELLEVLRRCRIFITNDSGPLHLASTLGVATVSFFGPESPMLYGPRGGDPLVFYEGIYCSPCLNVFNVKTAPCNGNNVCMKLIKAGDVLASMRKHFSNVWEQHARVN